MRPVYRDACILLCLLVFVGAPGVAQDAPPASDLVDAWVAETDYRKRSALQEELVERGKPGRDAVWRRLAGEPDESVATRLAYLIGRYRIEGTASRLEKLARDTQSRSLRSAAINSLGRQGEEGAQCLWRLYGSFAEARTWIVGALASCEGTSAAGFLARVVRKESDTRIGLLACRGLALHDPVVANDTFLRLAGKGSAAMVACQAGFLAEFVALMPEDEAEKARKKLRGLDGLLIHALEDEEEAAAVAEAAETLGLLGRPAAFDPLRKRLDTPQYSGMTAVLLRALGEIDAAGARDQLLDGLGRRDGPDHLVKRTALHELGRTGDPTVAGRIIEYLDHDDAAVRKAACEALAALDAREAAGEIAKRLLEERNKAPGSPGRAAARVSVSMARALGRLRDTDAVYPLSRLAREKEIVLRRAALEALARIPGSAATVALQGALSKGKEQPTLAAPLAAVLLSTESAVGPEDVARLLLGWTPNAVARSGLERALAEARDPGGAAGERLAAVSTALIPSLASAERDAAWGACWLLGRLGQPATVDPLIGALRRPEIRVEAAEALGRLEAAPAVEALLPLAANPIGEVARSAAGAILHILPLSDPRREVIARRVAHSAVTTLETPGLSEPMRRQALDWLELSAHPEGRAATLAVVVAQREAEPLRRAAARALGAIKPTTTEAETLLDLVPRARGKLLVSILDALLATRSAAIDSRVHDLAKDREDPVGRFALALYEIRCGRVATTRKLLELLESLRPVLRSADHETHLPAFVVLGWLTGEEGACRSLLPGTVPYGAGWRTSGRYRGIESPPYWEARRWLDRHRGELEDDAFFAAAVRAGREAKLKAYLRRFPDGRHAAEAERLLADPTGR